MCCHWSRDLETTRTRDNLLGIRKRKEGKLASWPGSSLTEDSLLGKVVLVEVFPFGLFYLKKKKKKQQIICCF